MRLCTCSVQEWCHCCLDDILARPLHYMGHPTFSNHASLSVVVRLLLDIVSGGVYFLLLLGLVLGGFNEGMAPWGGRDSCWNGEGKGLSGIRGCSSGRAPSPCGVGHAHGAQGIFLATGMPD